MIKNQINFKDVKSIEAYLSTLELKFSIKEKNTALILDNKDVTEKIRSNKINENVSEVSAIKIIREFMVRIQREMAKDIDCILEGRDIGTVVFPNADYKFFMTANDKSRAERRLSDLVSLGDKKFSEFDVVLDELRVRDHKDSTRNHSPLQKADDAIIIDTTHLAIDEVIKKIVNIVNHKRTLS